MRNDQLKISRTSADGLTVETWGFRARWPEPFQLREGRGEVALTLESYERGKRASKRHRILDPEVRLLFGGHYHNGQRVNAWMDVTRNSYAWDVGDLRQCTPTDARPTLPDDVAADAYNLLRPVIRIAENDAS